MKLIFLYGPPGVGKLTVAKELEKQTGYAIFHNHLFNDLVEVVFPFGTKEWTKHVHGIRRSMLAAAAKSHVPGMIMTMVYAHPSDDAMIRSYQRHLKKLNVPIHFVQLICNRKENERRVRLVSRRQYRKISTVNRLKEAFRQWDFLTPIPFAQSLTIDNTKLSPKVAATKIVSHYRIPRAKK